MGSESCQTNDIEVKKEVRLRSYGHLQGSGNNEMKVTKFRYRFQRSVEITKISRDH